MKELQDTCAHLIKRISSSKNPSFHIFWLKIPDWSHLKYYSCVFYSDIKRLGLLLQHGMRAWSQCLHRYLYLLSKTHKNNISTFWYILSFLCLWLSLLLEKRYRVLWQPISWGHLTIDQHIFFRKRNAL